MKFIKEVMLLLKYHHLKRNNNLLFRRNTQTKMDLLYTGIMDGHIQSDEEAIKRLYPNNKSRNTYFKLKSRLKGHLINQLVLIKLKKSEFTELQRVTIDCNKNWAAVRVLFGRGLRESGSYLAVKTLEQAIKYDFTEIVISLSRILRTYYATVTGDLKSFEKKNLLLKKYILVLESETKAEEYYGSLIGHFALSKASKKELINLAQQYSQALKQLDDCSSYRFLFYAYSVHIIRYEIENQHSQVLNECDIAIQRLKAKPFQLKTQITSFSLRKFSALLKLGHYLAAKDIIDNCKKDLEPSSLNWFLFYQLYFNYLTYTKKYHQIPEVIYPILTDKKLKSHRISSQESWKIIHAYIYLLFELKKIPTTLKDGFPKFRVNRFLNDIPTFSKDKRGHNIDVLILQIMIALAKGDYNFIIDRINAINRYATRYLKKDHTFRSNCFIQILIQLPKSGFYQERFLLNAKKYIKKLNEMPMKKADQTSEFEIIPYEHLLEWVIELCENPKNKEKQ